MRFPPSCGATKLLFKSDNIPILQPTGFAGSPASSYERKRNTMIAAIVRFLHEWNRYNKSLNELSRLGDRELADIGISRSDIVRVAWNSAHQNH